VRVERVALENHRDIAVLGSHVIHDAITDEDFAFRDFFKTRQHTQTGGLPAARRPYEHEKFFVSNLDGDTLNDTGIPETLDYISESYSCHNKPPCFLLGTDKRSVIFVGFAQIICKNQLGTS
jgi:hypothetical protein